MPGAVARCDARRPARGRLLTPTEQTGNGIKALKHRSAHPLAPAARGSRARTLAVALAGLALAACGGGPATEATLAPAVATPVPGAGKPCSPLVVIISLDGFRADYAARVSTPTFDRLAREGARVDRLIPPDPSLTFPGHATLATGASPERHGILANSFFDRERGRFNYSDEVSWYEVDPLWTHAVRYGRRAHVFHWVGSAGARQGIEPVWRAFDAKISDDTKVEQIIEWAQAPALARPQLIMSYFAGCDHQGHDHGPASPEVTACIGETDRRLGELLAGLEASGQPTTLMVVSDHGMLPTVGEVNPVVGLAEAGVKAHLEISGPVAHVYLDDRTPAGVAAAKAQAEKLAHLTVTVPAREARHPARTGDLVLRAEAGWHFNRKLKTYASAPGAPVLPGHHGGDPEDPQVSAIWYAWGAGIKPGAHLPRARAHDVAPTAARLLGLPPLPAAEGSAQGAFLDPNTCPVSGPPVATGR